MRPDTQLPDIHEPLTAAPRLRPDLVMQPQEFAGQACYVIEDPLRGRFFRVGIPEYEVLRRLDGRTSLAAAIGQAATTMGAQALGPQEGLAVCRWLAENQLLCGPGAGERPPRRRTLWQRFNPLVIKLPLVNPDRALAAALPWFGWLFSPGFLLLWACVLLYGGWLAVLHAGELRSEAAAVLDPGNWWRMLGVWLALKLVHESAHGLACKRYGGEVTRAGAMLILLAPVAYVDVTTSWRFRSKWQRIVTAAAGMYVELFVAAAAMIVWRQLDEGLARRLMFDLALMASAGTLLVNANPLMRFDGYFILSDLAGIPNLASCGQQWLMDRLQRLLGLQPPLPNWRPASRRIIAVYALASLAWRVFVYVAITLALIAWLSYAGGLLAAALLLWRGAPAAWQASRRLLQAAAGRRGVGCRLMALGASACAVMAMLTVTLLRPAWISAPAVAEYAPLTVLRAASPGFVEQVHVASGAEVAAGQPIVTLRNDELAIELAELNLAIEQSVLRARMHQQAGEQARYQAELAQRESLVEKRNEVRRRCGSLTVRATTAGRLASRSLEQLVGQHFEAGDEIAVLGDEAAKELLVAVAQDDLALFRSQLGRSVRITTADSRRHRFAALLATLEPRATQEPPHAALLAISGGPLPAMPRPAEQGSGDPQAGQLLSPHFTGRIALSPAESLPLRCGQLCRIGFRSPQETIAAHWLRWLQSWLREQLKRDTGHHHR
jgi:putative peptide zinc metalloprotease protein